METHLLHRVATVPGHSVSPASELGLTLTSVRQCGFADMLDLLGAGVDIVAAKGRSESNNEVEVGEEKKRPSHVPPMVECHLGAYHVFPSEDGT